MYKFWGKVRKHNQRGRKLGFPTANVNLSQPIPEGIYLSKTKINGKFYPSITFIGAAKTFNEKTYKAESFILDYSGDLYSKWISVYLLKKIRDNQKFDTSAQLVKQMKKDESAARKYFKDNIPNT